MDFSYFDVLIDAVFILNTDKACVYCNESAARLCGSSVKRMTRGKPLYDFIKFSQEDIFLMPKGIKGKDYSFPLTEIDFYLPPQSEVKGKIQLSISPFKGLSENLWIAIGHDVTVEQVLHEKYKIQLEQLESYSKNLEKMVEDRTFELKKVNNLLNAIMNSLGQGFLVFDESGTCLNVYTKACEDILETNPSGKNIVSILNQNEEEKKLFSMWIQAVFSKSLPFESLKELAPQKYLHSLGKHVTLDFFSLPDDQGNPYNLVLVATDRTLEHEAHLALENEKLKAKMIVSMVTSKRIFSNFINNLKPQLNQYYELLNNSEVDLNELFRSLHTLEGEAGAFYITEIKESTKKLQEIITKPRQEKSKNLFLVRDEMLFALQDLTNSVDKFIVENEYLISSLGLNKSSDSIEVDKSKILFYSKLFSKNGLKDSVNSSFVSDILKTPIISELQNAENILQSVAEKQSKKINPVKIIGGDTKVDSGKLSPLLSSFVHIYRNIIDHGIESPEERFDSGKNEFGNIQINIDESKESSILKIVISDDGRGINPELIRKKLTAIRPDQDWSLCSDQSILQEILSPGFSSRDIASEFSGRGVGMDAVNTEVLKLKGKIEVFSKLGKGSQFVIDIPTEDTYKIDKAS